MIGKTLSHYKVIEKIGQGRERAERKFHFGLMVAGWLISQMNRAEMKFTFCPFPALGVSGRFLQTAVLLPDGTRRVENFSTKPLTTN